METLMGQLSGFEASVLRLYLNGLSYSEIAAEVNKSPKSVDNAASAFGASWHSNLHLAIVSVS